MTIRTILVDDEKLAIQGLQLRLQKFPDIEIIDTCANGREAIRKIKTEKPDLVFLDIQMPGFDGFSVVKGVMEIEPRSSSSAPPIRNTPCAPSRPTPCPI
jgi:two-component system LytT family response regulator